MMMWDLYDWLVSVLAGQGHAHKREKVWLLHPVFMMNVCADVWKSRVYLSLSSADFWRYILKLFFCPSVCCPFLAFQQSLKWTSNSIFVLPKHVYIFNYKNTFWLLKPQNILKPWKFIKEVLVTEVQNWDLLKLILPNFFSSAVVSLLWDVIVELMLQNKSLNVCIVHMGLK